MLTRIGTVACNQVFPSSFCNQNYVATTTGLALLTGTAIITMVALKKLYFPEGLFPRDAGWNKLKERFEASGHPLSLVNKLKWQEIFKGFTGWIDGIFAKDLTKPIMWGQDNDGRKFVACRVKWWLKNTPEEKKVESFVIFQKYSDADCLIGTGQHVPFEWTKMIASWDVEFAQFLQGSTIEFDRWEFNQDTITYCCRLDLECDEIPGKSDYRFSLGDNSTNT